MFLFCQSLVFEAPYLDENCNLWRSGIKIVLRYILEYKNNKKQLDNIILHANINDVSVLT